jgi:hypothetical protein
MLRRLLKVADKLDKLGLTKEADLLDNVIKKMAAMGEGSPAWLEMDNPGKAGEDSDLSMNDEGELDYPEESTVKTRSSDPEGRSFSKANTTKLVAIATELFHLFDGCKKTVMETMEQADQDVFDLGSKIKDIEDELKEEYSNSLDSESDVEETLEDLYNSIEERGEAGHIPLGTEWAFIGEEFYSLCEYAESNLNSIEYAHELPISRVSELLDHLMDLEKFFTRAATEVDAAKEAFEELEQSDAYKEMSQVAEIIEPAADCIMVCHDAIMSAKTGIDENMMKLKKLIPEDLSNLRVKTPSEYVMPSARNFRDRLDETSPEQARFEESMFGLGRDTDNIPDETDEWDDYMY